MPQCNTTLEEQDIDEEPLFSDWTFHDLGLWITAVFALIATVISLFLIAKHVSNYSKPWEQRHIIRILFMIPIYAVVSYLCILYYHQAVYYEVLRDCYEAFAIASFFTLMCHYLAPNLHDQKNVFRATEPKNWVWPVPWAQKCTGGQDKGILKKPRSGLTWFNIVWIGVFHYCFIRVLMTIVSVMSEAAGVYCESSNHPAFAHVWTMVFNAAAVTIAMFCLIQFYFQMKDELAPHRPFLKILSIKLVIFFVFWQGLLIDTLASAGPLEPTKTLALADVQVGIPCVLISVEMTLFSILHLFSFPYKEYTLEPNTGGKFGAVALLDAFNPWDIVKALARGFRWLFVGVRHRHEDSSYHRKPGATMSGAKGSAGADTDSSSSDAGSLHDRQRYDAGAAVDLSHLPPKHQHPHGTEDDLYDHDGREGLLSNAAPHPSSSYPTERDDYLSQSVDSSYDHLHAGESMPYPTQYGGNDAPGVHTAVYGDERYGEMGYGGAQRPAGKDEEWDMFGGAGGPRPGR